MIKLLFPSVNENRYLFFQGACFGPFDPNGLFSGESVEFNSTLRSMVEERGIYGENTVEHQTISGEFSYHPMIAGCVPDPSARFPRRVIVPIWNYDKTQESTATSEFGLVIDKGSSLRYATDNLSVIQQVTWSRDPETGLWTIWLVSAYPSRCAADNVQRWDFISCRVNSVSNQSYFIRCRYRYYYGRMGGFDRTAYDWSILQPASIISSLPGSSTPLQDYVGDWGAYMYLGRIPNSATSPSSLKQKIDSLISIILPDKYPIPDYPYGDLVMRALNQVSAVNFNMTAFLRDLRRPQDMIPKLSNLKSLKSWSSRFLSVKYGALPTIDDIRSLISAFKKRQPYLDKNGFRIFSAGETSRLTQNEINYELIQYAKVALDREDTDLARLTEAFENIGMFPSFENIWDLIPYSFVVDWLIDVGELLKRVDTNLRLLRLNIRYVTMSRKTTVSGTSEGEYPNLPFIGTVEWTRYHRWVTSQCPGPTLSLKPQPAPTNHWLEAGALLLQRS